MILLALWGCGADVAKAKVDEDGDGATVDVDCDDQDAARAPGRDEVCGDGIDNDCDGAPGECAWGDDGVRVSDWGFEGGQEGGHLGSAMDVADMTGDGVSDLLVGEPGSDGGAAWLLPGPLAADVGLSVARTRVEGVYEGDCAGASVRNIGDVDLDGIDDVAVTAPCYAWDSGIVYLLQGRMSEGDFSLDASTLDPLVGQDYGDNFGTSISRVGDIDGNGSPDLAIGAPVYDGHREAVVHIVSFRNRTMWDYVTSVAFDDSFGAAVDFMDMDGDGQDDVLIGVPGDDELGLDTGKIVLLPGPLDYDNQSLLAGEAVLGEVGYAVAVLGDVDGDGLDDYAAGAPGQGVFPGKVFLVLGGHRDRMYIVDAEATVVGVGYDRFGASLEGVGDVDGDGVDDLLVGAPGLDEGAGGAFLVPFSVRGVVSVADVAAPIGGAAERSCAGVAVAGGGDLDGDDVFDVAIGAPGCDADDVGGVYLVPGAVGI